MWGGRFAEGPAAVMREINASIPFDKRLWQQDIAGSKAHVAMLAAQKIVSAADAAEITRGLDLVAEEYRANGVPVDLALEDIHMATEGRLAELIGAPAGAITLKKAGVALVALPQDGSAARLKLLLSPRSLLAGR